MPEVQTIEFTDDPPFACPPDKVISFDLPPPVSVNRTRRIDWTANKLLNRWKRRADMLIMANGGVRKLGKMPGKFEVKICLDEHHVGIDADNAAKSLIDYCRRLELIVDDSPKYMRRVIIEWGYVPHGCRITLREVAA